MRRLLMFVLSGVAIMKELKPAIEDLWPELTREASSLDEKK